MALLLLPPRGEGAARVVARMVEASGYAAEGGGEGSEGGDEGGV